MPKFLKKFLGLLLLITTIVLATYQSMTNATNLDNTVMFSVSAP